jgi:hypothetical protein
MWFMQRDLLCLIILFTVQAFLVLMPFALQLIRQSANATKMPAPTERWYK